MLQAFGEVETALTNGELFAERLQYERDALGDRTEAVRLAKIRYTAGASDLLTVLILQTQQIKSQAEVIQLRNVQLANRINLHLALGGGFDAAPATSPGAPQIESARAPLAGGPRCDAQPAGEPPAGALIDRRPRRSTRIAFWPERLCAVHDLSAFDPGVPEPAFLRWTWCCSRASPPTARPGRPTSTATTSCLTTTHERAYWLTNGTMVE